MSTAVALTSNMDVNVGNVTASLESGLQKHTGVFFWLVCILLSDYIQLYCTIKLCVCVFVRWDPGAQMGAPVCHVFVA